MPWGILAPDTVVSQRRQQNLGLAAAVRHFNDRAVPGIGGMWFPMPILCSCGRWMRSRGHGRESKHHELVHDGLSPSIPPQVSLAWTL